MKNQERTQDNRRYYLSEFSLYDGDHFITFNIVDINTDMNEITVAVSNEGKISLAGNKGLYPFPKRFYGGSKMCVIVYKPENIKMPDTDTLKNCFENNEDGAGYMFADKGKVHIVKGLMTYDSFISSLVKTVSVYGQYIPYVLHFRLTTQAGVREDCTHPYPLSKRMSDLRKLKTDCDMAIAHNGIINLTSSLRKDVTYNDTMEFITDYLSLIIKNRDYYKDADTIRLIERLSESRLAILDGNGHCELTGEGWIKDDGVFYSNEGYLPSRFSHHFSYLNDIYSCPVYEDGDDSRCADCENYGYCYEFDGEPETAGDIKITYLPDEIRERIEGAN